MNERPFTPTEDLIVGAKFYHPANSRIYFWGDDDVEERLNLMDLNLMDEHLSDFGPSPESKPASEIDWQKKTPQSANERRYVQMPSPLSIFEVPARLF